MLSKEVSNFLKDVDGEIEVVCGGAKGADELGEWYARRLGYRIKFFEAEWNKHGKKAGMLRNLKMAKYADTLIAFWDGKSRGTNNMITVAKQNGLNIKVIEYGGN